VFDWRDGQKDEDPLIETLPDDDVIQLYTSGTTGHPKGVQLTNNNFSSANIMAKQGYYRQSFREESVNLVCMPVFHVAGTNMGLAGYVFGCKSIIIPKLMWDQLLE
jgi:acyl-CoA synthetase (AMP-forming)/AMP-acid ligase II